MKHALYSFFCCLAILLFADNLLLKATVAVASQRVLQYHPMGEGFGRQDGWNRYTRALYGSHSNWRLETSDRPLFAAFDKGKGWNIQFALRFNGVVYPLDSTEHCRSLYIEGHRQYDLTDSRWGSGTMTIDVWAEHTGSNALWRFELSGFPRTAQANRPMLIAIKRPIAKTKMKRNGDLGTDPRENFDPIAPCPDSLLQCVTWAAHGVSYLRLEEHEQLRCLKQKEGKALAEELDTFYRQLTSQLVFQTPDPLINTLGATLMAAADGLWDGETWQHGCIGWRTPLAGWRGGYVGDVTGWFDRQRKHFRAYAASMVRDIEPVRSHPAQDTTKNLVRSAEEWGTPMYSNGYICKLPNNDRKMSHYDMNLNYVDELLWHFQYDADTALMREFWPTLQLHHQWEKRNWDPDGDHLYDGYCCIWASDALYYNSGAVTHASAYNYRGNLLTARVAELIGEDPAPYQEEASAILKAMNERLWIETAGPVEGHWAEFQDFMGLKRLHPDAALWSIYTPIDCGACDAMQAYQATRWVDACIPHIPLELEVTQPFAPFTLSTSDWMPYAWSTNNVAHEEVANMALAYFIAGRREAGYQLLYSDLLDEMCAGDCPGNFGQISHYDKALKEAYRDFGDNIGITSRAIVQGLFGIRPDALYGRCYLQPGFPVEWDSVSVKTPYFSYRFHREGDKDCYDIEQNFPQALQIILRLPTGDGRFIEVAGNNAKSQHLTIATSKLPAQDPPAAAPYRPNLDEHALGLDEFRFASETKQIPLDLTPYYNASVDDIYRQQYLSPRSPYTTLELPSQGMGDWCVPTMTAQIEDDGLRAKVSEDGLFDTGRGVLFRLPKEGRNCLYTSLWDNYPDSVSVIVESTANGQQSTVNGQQSALCLMLAGSTNNMQSRIDNALLIAHYDDGKTDTLHLINPYNWCPIEQDYYYDDHAYWSTCQHPYRVHLGSGLVSRSLKEELQRKGRDNGAVNIHVTDFDADTPIAKGLSIPDGAAQLLMMPLSSGHRLISLTLRTLSNDVVVGIMAATLIE